MKANGAVAATVHWAGVSYRTLLSSEASGGAMSIVESVSPAGSGPPRHVHHQEDETFVILDGECELWVAGKTFVLGSGGTTLIPRGTEHTFRIVGKDPCRHLIVLTPGGFEGFFIEMARGNYRIPQDMDAIDESAARHHLSFTGPPL